MLGLQGEARKEDFFALCDNLDPRTGLPLTTYTRDGRRVGIDLNFNSTKSVGIVRELAGENNQGDDRVEVAHREAVAYAMRYVEAEMRGRVRIGGKDEDRLTGNMVAMRVTHRDTRISGDDAMPDMSLHDHVVVFNATYDRAEQKWKAAQIGQIKHDAPYYEAIYHNRLASNLRELGYGIRRKGKAFEVAGVSEELVKKFSRRRAYIDKVAEKLGISSAAGRDTLGASTRLAKTKEVADDLNGYWVSRLTELERRALTQLIGRQPYVSNERESVEFAIEHMFERSSVVDERRLYEAAIRHGIGSVTPEGVLAEAKRQGVLVRNGEATTRQVLAEERRIIDFAREGRGTMRPLGHVGFQHPARHSLSSEQQAICRHVWQSPDQVILIRGAAGTGKTRTMSAAVDGIDKPVVVLAPSAEASRGVLRKEGFAQADTVARFLMDNKMQDNARGGVIWVDEAGLLGIRQLAELFDIAQRQNSRVILQGDRRQHGSVERGATLRVLEEFAGLPVAELRDIRRQRGDYKAAVELLSKGNLVGGYEKLSKLGWVQEITAEQGNTPLVEDYLAALDAKKSVLVVAPTHVEGAEIAADIRAKLQERGIVSKHDRVIETLVPLDWTEAERGDLERYDGTEVMQFHRNSGTFRAGQRIKVTDWNPGQGFKSPMHFAVYAHASIRLGKGDTVRITANGTEKSGKHKLNNGSTYTVAGFTKTGDIQLENGWVISKDFGHLTHGYVATSHASQGKTVDRVLIAMGSESRPAINAEQFYVSVSRGREKAAIYTELPPEQLREAIQRSDGRKSATEMMGRPEPPVKAKGRKKLREFMERVARVYRQLREKASAATTEKRKEKERGHER
jgi:conjugative relaxase-like TrwC/TraI family protein